MEQKIFTILVVPRALVREALESLLSNTNYKPSLSLSSFDELNLDDAFTSEILLFVITRDALAKIGSKSALPELHLLKRHHPDSRVLVLSDAFNLADVVAALRAGANGYLVNTLTADALVKSLDLVVMGETVLTSQFTHAVSDIGDDAADGAAFVPVPAVLRTFDEMGHRLTHLEHPVAHQMSSREIAILSRLIQGDSNKLIARGIGVAEATVKTHIKAILRKIRVKNRTQAAMWAYTHLPEACSDVIKIV